MPTTEPPTTEPPTTEPPTTEPPTPIAPLTPVTTPSVTLVEGPTFALSSGSGDMDPGQAHGLFHADTRFLSGYRLLLDGDPPEPLSAQPDTPYAITFLARRQSATTNLLVERHRYVGDGLREDLVLRNLGRSDCRCRISIEVDVDFADLFSVKDRAPRPLGEVGWTADGPDTIAQAYGSSGRRGVRLHLDGATGPTRATGATRATGPNRPGTLTVDATVPALGTWQATLAVQPIIDDAALPQAFPTDRPVTESEPERRRQRWHEDITDLAPSDPDLARTLRRTVEDLGALRLPDGAVAAGAPWFMTLFGRDSLLTAWMALPLTHDLALSTLRALARRQGDRVDPTTEQEPGKILHEVRQGTAFPLSPGADTYYGSVDSTPLFCLLAGELHRRGIPLAELEPLLDHVDRALDWIRTYGDRDGDGFCEYQRSTGHGLAQQGWKDSGDSIAYADGTAADPPIALCEVQGYAYAAFRARADLARALGDEAAERTWAERADDLRRRFHEAFWLPDRGHFALALDGDKRPVDALASNMGHCLWTGIVDPSVAGRVTDHLMSEEMFSGWGIRTLATTMAAYDPVSYHNGSVWPHDTALVAAGLARYGYTQQARVVARAVLDAATPFSGRLPELFCGFDRATFPQPVPYPTSCSPQAWAAASPLVLAGILDEPSTPNTP